MKLKILIFGILMFLIKCTTNDKKNNKVFQTIHNEEYILSSDQSQDVNKETYNKVIFLAEREWVKIYGNKIYSNKPFIVKIKNDSIWSVEGTLPVDFDGGVPYAEINIKTFEISNITHGK
jgi:hypothetical lipoprotein